MQHTRASCRIRQAAVARAQRKINSLIGGPPDYDGGTLTTARGKYLRLEEQFKAALTERKQARKSRCPRCKQYAKKGGHLPFSSAEGGDPR